MLATFFIILAAVVVAVVYELSQRLKRLEKRVEKSAHLISAVDRLGASILGPGEYEKVEDVWDSLKVLERIGSRLAKQTPALRRVLQFSIGVNLDYFCEKTGITVEDLKAVEQQLAPAVFWPASQMTIEEWSTHTQVWDYSGRRCAVFYPGTKSFWEPSVIWSHFLPERDEDRDRWSQPRLEVVLHGDAIKFWALGGRFDSRFNFFEARDENVFVEIPLSEEKLSMYRWRPEPTDDPELKVREYLWLREYHWVCGEEERRWRLNIIDIPAYVEDYY